MRDMKADNTLGLGNRVPDTNGQDGMKLLCQECWAAIRITVLGIALNTLVPKALVFVCLLKSCM